MLGLGLGWEPGLGAGVCQADTCGAEDHGEVAIAHGQRGQVRESVGQLLDKRHPRASWPELIREGEAGSTVPG